MQRNLDPANRDSDFDGFADGYEADRAGDGFDPAVVNDDLSKQEYVADFIVGATCGSFFGFCEMDNIPWLLGNLTSGFFAFGDVRDAISGIIHGDRAGTLLGAGGLIPLAGDAVKTANDVVKFLRSGSSTAERPDGRHARSS